MQLSADRLPARVPARGLSGNLRELLAAPYAFLADAAERHDGIASFRVFHRTFVVVSDARLIEQALVTDAALFVKGRQYKNVQMLIGRGLVTLPDGPWQEHRRVIQPGFHRKALTHLAGVVTSAVERRLAEWREGGSGRPFPVVTGMRAISEQVISEVLLGTPVEEMISARVSALFEDAFRALAVRNWSPVSLPAFVPTRGTRMIAAKRRALYAFLETRMEARLAEGVGTHGDVLDMLLLAHIDPGDRQPAFSREDVIGEMSTLYLAGYETTAATLSWALYFLARYPDVQSRLHEEVRRVLGKRPPSWDDIPALVYTGQVISETLRLRPAIHTIARVATRTTSLGGYRIPAGTTVMFSFYGLHRSPRYWPAPATFDPDRFDPAVGRSWPKLAYMPFSIGQHRCIGANLAIAEATLALAEMARRVELHLPPGMAELQPVNGLTHFPKPFELLLTPRSPA